MKKYVPSAENRKRWCQGKIGNPHQFEYYHYFPKVRGYPDHKAYFEFRCILCGRRRYCVDEEGQVELPDGDWIDEEETPAPRPTHLRLRVCVEAEAEDGTLRRIANHIETWNVAAMSDASIDEFRTNLLKAAYMVYEAARNFDLMPPSDVADPLQAEQGSPPTAE